MKKLLAIVLTLALALTMLAGCGGSPAASASGSGDAASPAASGAGCSPSSILRNFRAQHTPIGLPEASAVALRIPRGIPVFRARSP